MEYSKEVGKWKILEYSIINYMGPERFPAFHIALYFAMKGGLMPAIMNAANEIAVTEGFLKGKIKFTDIGKIILNVCSIFERDYKWDVDLTWENVLKTNERVREYTKNLINSPVNGSLEDINLIEFAREHQRGVKK